jgi:serine/threonine-protein kinase
LLQPGTRVGRFLISDRLGAGGMGEVYRARDSRLARDVAIKTLGTSLVHDPELVARFEREAMTASALNHPNIVTIYDIGQEDVDGRNLNYIAMELIEGETLTARIARSNDTGTTLGILTDVADALAQAHAAGIVHRDLKPDNIMITRDGLAKILDFGLAKLVQGDLSALASEDATVARSPISRDGVVVGTVAYMSPEQASGKAVDHRSDVFAFGSILHEAFTRRRAWSGATVVDTLYQIMHSELREESEIPANVQRIIRRCVAKSPEDRYQSARELAADLRAARLGPPGDSASTSTSPVRRPFPRRVVAISAVVLLAAALLAAAFSKWGAQESVSVRTIAVLPFAAPTDADSQAVADGVVDGIIHRLSQLSSPKVKARSTVFHYRNASLPPDEIGRRLAVDAVVTGEVSRRGDTVLVRMEMVDVEDGSQLWGERFERRSDSLLSMQEEIVRALVQKLRPDVTPAEKRVLAHRETADPAAFQLYLKGRHWWNKRSPAAARTAISFFQQSIDRDPTYARAWAGLADSYNILGAHGAMEPHEAFERAKAAARQAIAIAPNDPEPYASLGDANIHYDWDFAEAGRNLRRSIELKPDYATAHHWYAEALAVDGRPADALLESRRACELEPLSIMINAFLARHLRWQGRPDESLKQARHALEIEESAVGHFEVGRALEQLGRRDEAIAEYERASSMSPDVDYPLAALAHAHGRKGDRVAWEQQLSQLLERRRTRYVSGVELALVYLGAGDTEKAIEWLRKAVSERDGNLPFIAIDPLFVPLHADGRFQEIVATVRGSKARG